MPTAKKSSGAKKAAAKKSSAKSASKSAAKKGGAAKKAGATKGGAAKKSAAKKGGATKSGATKGGAAKKSTGSSRGAAKKSGGARKSGGGTKRALNPALAAPMNVSPELGAVVGNEPMPRSEVTKRIWAYIKKNGLQDQQNRRAINADDRLRPIFGGKSQVSMFDMTKLVNQHMKPA